ncbi:MAG: cyclic lactone autoinducer peptide [bacterium]|nr:cyclic lactone autoinducer peptide [bacterium]MCM1424617.1 cyclic lactone autoinducer peptide [bacterium]
MKTKKLSETPRLGLKLLERAAFASAHAGANSACSYIYHDPKKPAALKELKKF